MLYLNGVSKWSYWIGFYIVDYLKLFIFTIFLIIPYYFIKKEAIFYIYMLTYNLSSLSFIYFISFFCSKDYIVSIILCIITLIIFFISFIIIEINGDWDGKKKMSIY